MGTTTSISVCFEYEITDDDLQHLKTVWKGLKRTSKMTGVYAWLVTLGGILVYDWVRLGHAEPFTVTLLVLSTGLAWLVHSVDIPGRCLDERVAYLTTNVATLNNEGVTIEGEKGVFSTAWTEFDRWFDDDQLLILLKPTYTTTLLPRRAFSDSDWTTIRSFVASRLKDARTYRAPEPGRLHS